MVSIPSEHPYGAAYYAGRDRFRDRFIESMIAVKALRSLPGMTVLDIGCGTGPLFPLLRQAGLAPVGIDTNVAALSIAANRGGTALLTDGSPVLPFQDACVGAIVAQHLIEHLPSPGAALLEWRRVLQLGGRLVVLTPNRDHPDPVLFADPDHKHLFDATSLHGALQMAGYHHVVVSGLFPYVGKHRLGRALSRRAWRLIHAPSTWHRARTLVAVGTR